MVRVGGWGRRAGGPQTDSAATALSEHVKCDNLKSSTPLRPRSRRGVLSHRISCGDGEPPAALRHPVTRAAVAEMCTVGRRKGNHKT